MSPIRLVETLARAAEGWAVHPLYGISNGQCDCWKGANCPKPGKHPRLDNWPSEATTDPVKIRQWWQRWPTSNVGGAAGKKSGRNVLDVDPRNGGDISLELLEQQHRTLPETQETATGSGGWHLHFAYSGVTLANTAGVLGAGLDIRSDGGNVVLPGSVHISGRVYEYEATHSPEDILLALMPTWLILLLQGHRKGRLAPPPGPLQNGTVHYTLVSWAGAMHARGMSPGAILAALQHENATRCEPARPVENIKKIVEDITRRYERGPVPGAGAACAPNTHQHYQEDEAAARAVLAQVRGGVR